MHHRHILLRGGLGHSRPEMRPDILHFSEAPGQCCCCSSQATNHNQQRTSQPRCRGKCVWPGPLSVGNCFVVFSPSSDFSSLHCFDCRTLWSNSGRCVYLYDPASVDVFHLMCPVKAYPGNQTLSVAFAFLGSLLSLQPGEFTRTELHFLAVVWWCYGSVKETSQASLEWRVRIVIC